MVSMKTEGGEEHSDENCQDYFSAEENLSFSEEEYFAFSEEVYFSVS